MQFAVKWLPKQFLNVKSMQDICVFRQCVFNLYNKYALAVEAVRSDLESENNFV